MNAQSLVRALEWIVATRTRLALALSVGAAVMVGGFYTTTVPWKLRERSINTLAEGINAQVILVNTAQQQWEDVDQWYDPSYSTDIESYFADVDITIAQAQDVLATAQGFSDPDRAVSAANVGEERLDAAVSMLDFTAAIVGNTLHDRDTARALLSPTRSRAGGIAATKAVIPNDF